MQFVLESALIRMLRERLSHVVNKMHSRVVVKCDLRVKPAQLILSDLSLTSSLSCQSSWNKVIACLFKWLTDEKGFTNRNVSFHPRNCTCFSEDIHQRHFSLIQVSMGQSFSWWWLQAVLTHWLMDNPRGNVRHSKPYIPGGGGGDSKFGLWFDTRHCYFPYPHDHAIASILPSHQHSRKQDVNIHTYPTTPRSKQCPLNQTSGMPGVPVDRRDVVASLNQCHW